MEHSEPKLVRLAVGERYHVDLPPMVESSRAEFFREAGNTLLIAMPDLTKHERKMYRKGDIKVGLVEVKDVLFIAFQFDKQYYIMSPFDAALIPEEEWLTWDGEPTSPEMRMLVSLELVDTRDNVVKGLRAFTLHPALTKRLLDVAHKQRRDTVDQALITSQVEGIMRNYDNIQMAKMVDKFYPIGT